MLTGVFGTSVRPDDDGDGLRCAPAAADLRAVVAVAFAHGWVTVPSQASAEVRFRPVTP